MAESRSLTDKFMLRLPDGMRERIKSAAENNGRSMNSEIVATLYEKYPAPKFPDEREELLQSFLDILKQMPENEAESLLMDFVRKAGISDDDIRDGFIPGLTLRDE